MGKKRVTSKMVAQRAGVSQTTVSFVLNKVKGQHISPETTERVLTAARELGYVPDATARMLARGVSNNVALVLTRPHDAVLSDEYVSYVLTGIAQVFRKESFRILVEFVNEGNQADTYLNLAHGKEAVGLIVIPYKASSSDIDTMINLSEEGFPIISLAHMDDRIRSVAIDHLGGIRQLLAHLHQLGHQRIGAISYAPRDLASLPADRLAVYRDFLHQHNLPYHEDYVCYGAFSPESGYQAMCELLALAQPPTAVYALNDVMAFGAMTAVHEHGLRVPQDIAVVGYDGIHLARYTTPALTTVQAPTVQQGRIAGEMLRDLIQGKALASDHIVLTPELIIRQSCGYQQQ
ncbi:MAG: LacI family DNA-binding transcriptional regulator [Anaerolineae bacterium]